MLTVADFGESGAGESPCGGGDVTEIVGWLEEGFALVADAVHGLQQRGEAREDLQIDTTDVLFASEVRQILIG